jgi:hypothetical protein
MFQSGFGVGIGIGKLGLQFSGWAVSLVFSRKTLYCKTDCGAIFGLRSSCFAFKSIQSGAGVPHSKGGFAAGSSSRSLGENSKKNIEYLGKKK